MTAQSPKLKLHSIETNGQPKLKPHKRKGYWKLTEDYRIRLHTDLGVIEAMLYEGWVTDLRSGSSACDLIAPKRGNDAYNGIILFHDFSYSGHISKALADYLLKQGMILSGISEWRANLAYKAVKWFGESGYYEIIEPMPAPYTNNRIFEKITWGAK